MLARRPWADSEASLEWLVAVGHALCGGPYIFGLPERSRYVSGIKSFEGLTHPAGSSGGIRRDSLPRRSDRGHLGHSPTRTAPPPLAFAAAPAPALPAAGSTPRATPAAKAEETDHPSLARPSCVPDRDRRRRRVHTTVRLSTQRSRRRNGGNERPTHTLQ